MFAKLTEKSAKNMRSCLITFNVTLGIGMNYSYRSHVKVGEIKTTIFRGGGVQPV